MNNPLDVWQVYSNDTTLSSRLNRAEAIRPKAEGQVLATHESHPMDDGGIEKNSDKVPDQICSICLEPFRLGENLAFSRTDRCLHAFHRDCITEWLLKHAECPCCRTVLIESVAEYATEDDYDLEHGLAIFDILQRESDAPALSSSDVEVASNSE